MCYTLKEAVPWPSKPTHQADKPPKTVSTETEGNRRPNTAKQPRQKRSLDLNRPDLDSPASPCTGIDSKNAQLFLYAQNSGKLLTASAFC